jgi:hypothetical protein
VHKSMWNYRELFLLAVWGSLSLQGILLSWLFHAKIVFPGVCTRKGLKFCVKRELRDP